MLTEFEIKVLNIDAKQLTGKLQVLGFTPEPPQAFRRYVYTIDTTNAWLRLRTNGKHTTLTYKHFETDNITGVKELEVVVDDFEKTHELLQLLGYSINSYQENRRRNFTLDDIVVSIDDWPLIPTYAEIEGASETSVVACLTELDLQDYQTTSKPTSYVYELNGLDIKDFPNLKFS